MKAMIVFESMFGNTRQIAQALADGLSPYGEVAVLEVGVAAQQPFPTDVDLLVIGGPTHAYSMSRPRTREDAAKQTKDGVISGDIGVREWIGALPELAKRLPTATFDTRLRKPRWLTGAASRSAESALKRHGVRRLLGHQSFVVEGMTGPLVGGETERARDWAKSLVEAAATARAR